MADVAIGMNLARLTSTVEVTLTLNLSLDFISQAREGDWIEAHVELNKEGGRVRLGQCRIVVGDSLVVRGTAVFYVP
ncbi:hotdog domain-containing protein [Noviherbaspirillum saxi]|uniref:PaaI family thioesterase n=1 Tax=Noviherbaspirillum saxi TaxID=2320863 RepID=UPI0013146856